MSVKDHLPGQEWLSRHVETDPDADCEATHPMTNRDEARERLARALDLLPGVKSRLKSGQQPNAYESGSGYVVGIGPVANCLSLATTTHAAVADLLEQALRLALLSPEEVGGSDQPQPSVSDDTQNMEALSTWMIANSYATGHGDTVEDLLRELDWQHAKKIAALSSAIRILSDTGRSDSARILDARDRLIIGRGEIMRHSTDDDMNAALSKDAALLEAFGQDAGPTIEELFDDCGWVPYVGNGWAPVQDGAVVTLRFRDGSEMTDTVHGQVQWYSGEDGYEDAADVVAYRIVTDNG